MVATTRTARLILHRADTHLATSTAAVLHHDARLRPRVRNFKTEHDFLIQKKV